MKKLPLLFILLALFFPGLALAKVEVNVKNQFNSQTTTSNTSDNQTHIRIETNGEVKEYNGSDENVHLESSNGKNTVTITNNNSSPTPKPSESVSPKPSASPSPSPSSSPENKPKFTSLFDLIKKQFELIMELFRN